MKVTLRRRALVALLALAPWLGAAVAAEIGREVAVSRHLQDGEEFHISLREVLEHGRRLFTAVWTIQEGGAGP